MDVQVIIHTDALDESGFVKDTRPIDKRDKVLNLAVPIIKINLETSEVCTDEHLLTCRPATELPMAENDFIFRGGDII